MFLFRIFCLLTKHFYFVELPDPFAKISVDGSGQCHSTDTCKATLDPKWNQHYDLYVLIFLNPEKIIISKLTIKEKKGDSGNTQFNWLP